MNISATEDHETRSLFASRERLRRAIDKVLDANHDAVNNPDVILLWEFIWLFILPKVYKSINSKEENSIWSDKYAGDVTAKALMELVNISDEALILAVLQVRQDTCGIFGSCNTLVSGLSANSSEDSVALDESASSVSSNAGDHSGFSISGSKRKMKAQAQAKKRGRSGNRIMKKRVAKKDIDDEIKELSKMHGYMGCKKPLPENVATLNDDDECDLEYTVSLEMGKYEEVYRTYYRIVKNGRKGLRNEEDPYKWYHAIAEKIKTMKAEVKEMNAVELAMLPRAVGTAEKSPSPSVLPPMVVGFEMPDLQSDDANIMDSLNGDLFEI